MNQIEFFRGEAASASAYYDVLSMLVRQAEIAAGPSFDHEFNLKLIATAAAYVFYQHAGEHFSCLEANRLRRELHEIADSVFETLGYEGYKRPEQRRRLEGDDEA